PHPYALIGLWKHPHGRGEDQLLQLRRRQAQETPPRTWGRRSRRNPSNGDSGNTPTDVGKTGFGMNFQTSRQKHPHGRGEDTCGCAVTRTQTETPPRTWGRQGQPPRRPPRYGNTPTDVGKTESRFSMLLASRKHPHGRGEDGSGRAAIPGAWETPPRTWGRRSPLR